MTTNSYISLLILSVFISSLSQILLKKSALESHKNIMREYMNAKVISAYLMFFVAVFMDLAALRYVPASFVPVAETSSYTFLMVFGRIIFKERISRAQGIGMVIVVAGIALYVL